MKNTLQPRASVKTSLRVNLIKAAVATGIVGAIVGAVFFLISSVGNPDKLFASGEGAITIWSEDFSGSDGLTSTDQWYTDDGDLSLSSGDYFEQRSNRFEARDIDGEGIWYSEIIDISDYTNVTISFEAKESGSMESSDYFKSYYKVDGGAEVEFETNGDLNDDFGTKTVEQTGLSGSTVQIVIYIKNNSYSEQHYIDDVLVEGELDLSTPATVELFNEPFNYVDGTTSGSGWTIDASGVNGDFFVYNNSLIASDADNGAVFKVNPIDISGYSNVSISVEFGEDGDLETADTISFLYKIDGGSWTPFSTNGINVDDLSGIETASETGLSGSSLEVMARMRNTANTEYYGIDNFVIGGTLEENSSVVAGYGSYKLITLDPDNTCISADLEDFPMLFSETQDYLKTTANGGGVENSDGYDIVFTNADGSSLLNHEIERYNGSTGEYIAWVQVPNVSASSATEIRMYYGNSAVSTDPSVDSTWDASFTGIWHMEDGDFSDATSFANNGTNYGSSNIAGKIGDGRDFDGSNDYIDAGSDASLVLTEGATVSAWVYQEGEGHIINMGGGWSDPGYSLFWLGSNLRIELQRSGEKTMCDNGGGGGGVWHHVAFTWSTDDNTIRTYVDGELQSSTCTFNGPLGTPGQNLNIGRNQLQNYYFNGRIDEARVANIARSSDWMAAEYCNQNDPSSFYTISEETFENEGGLQGFEWRQLLTVNSSEVCGTHENFTVLVSLEGEDYKTVENGGKLRNANGYDINFAIGETVLNHQLEDYDGENGSIVAWVQLPYVSDVADTTFYMYFGDSTATEDLSTINAWDEYYDGVWHLNDGDLSDATGNGWDGTNGGSVSGGEVIAGSREFDGDNDYVDVGNMDVSGSGITISGWFYANSFGFDPRIISKTTGTDVSDHYWELAIDETSSTAGQMRFRVRAGGSAVEMHAGSVSSGTLYYVTATFDGSNMRIYVDGVLQGTQAKSGTIGTNSSVDTWLGGNPSGATIRAFDGLLDEIRVSNIARTADWICTDLSSQGEPNVFITPGAIEYLGEGGGALPIELLYFDAEAEGDNTVLCTWASSIEIDNDYYTIERSADGTDFEEIGEVSGAGNSTQRLDYSFVDEAPMEGINYYRLKQTDYNGEYEYFNIVPVMLEGTKVEVGVSDITVGPNPYQSSFTIRLNSTSDGPAEVYMMNINGAMVSQRSVSLYAGNNTINMNEQADLPAGVYFITIQQNGEMTDAIKLIKSE